MATFRYQARDGGGGFVEGTWDAPDARQAREDLHGQGLSLLKLEAEEAATPLPPVTAKGWDWGVSRASLARFTRQLSAILTAGLPLLKALDTVSRRSAGPTLRRAVVASARQIQEGKSFSQALTQHPLIFDDLYVAMIRVGETTGDLARATDRLAILLEKEVAAQRRVGLAMTYPLIVLAVTAVLTWGMATFMMPIFEPIFRDAGLNLERDFPVTWMLLRLGHLGGSPLFLGGLLVGALALGWALHAFGKTAGGRRLFDRLRLSVPVLSGLLRKLLTARMARGLASLTQGNVPLMQALSQAGAATGNRVFAEAADALARRVAEGQRLSQRMAEDPLFDPVLVDMVEVGEQSGSLPEMLDRCADYLDDEAETARDVLTAALEPLLMLIVGAIVSVFVVSLMVPMMSVGSR